MTQGDGDRTLQRLRSYSTGNQKWVDYFNFAQPFCVCRQSELSTNHCVHFTFLGYLIPLCVNMHRAGLISPYYFIYLRGKPIIVQHKSSLSLTCIRVFTALHTADKVTTPGTNPQRPPGGDRTWREWKKSCRSYPSKSTNKDLAAW